MEQSCYCYGSTCHTELFDLSFLQAAFAGAWAVVDQTLLPSYESLSHNLPSTFLCLQPAFPHAKDVIFSGSYTAHWGMSHINKAFLVYAYTADLQAARLYAV